MPIIRLSRLSINDLSTWPPRIVPIDFTGFSSRRRGQIVRFNSVYAARLIGLASDLGLDIFAQLPMLKYSRVYRQQTRGIIIDRASFRVN